MYTNVFFLSFILYYTILYYIKNIKGFDNNLQLNVIRDCSLVYHIHRYAHLH